MKITYYAADVKMLGKIAEILREQGSNVSDIVSPYEGEVGPSYISTDAGFFAIMTAHKDASMEPTKYTVIVPGVPAPHRTQWHPDNIDSPPLSRGSFKNYAQALGWARDNLCGTPYLIKEI